MRPLLDVWFPGLPIAQPRPRMGKGGNVYQAPRQAPIHVWKATMRLAGEKGMAGRPCSKKPIKFLLEMFFPRPKRLPPGPRVPFTKRPDRDNLAKAPQDALETIAWNNDSQIFDGHDIKWYAGIGDSIGTRLRVWEWE